MSERFIVTVVCKDKPGIVNSISQGLLDVNGNIVESQQYYSPETGMFFLRIEADADATYEELEMRLASAKKRFDMDLGIYQKTKPVRTLIMCSKDPRTVNELLFKHHMGGLNIEVPLIVSNHMDLKPHADFYNTRFHQIPITQATKPQAEEELWNLIQELDIELVVLARYMQIFSDELTTKLTGMAINIHHSFLPAFKGAKPYHQAHDRGVKLIGATAHYVTEDLDEGPIIEQEVVRVSHAESARELQAIGRDVEGQTLAKAVMWHTDRRVLMDGNRTVVFK